MLHKVFAPEAFSERNTELMLAVGRSVFGQALNQQIRYERYVHIPEGVAHLNLPPDRKKEVHANWTESLMDADTNNLQHNVLTALIGRHVCQVDEIDEETTELVVKTLLVHDLKEYVLDPNTDLGDETYDDAVRKGAEGYSKEHHELGEILKSSDFSMVSCHEIEQIVEALNDSKISPSEGGPKTQAGQIIEIAERLGYMHSALRAQRAVDEYYFDFDHPQKDKLLWLSENVLGNHITRLIELAERSETVRQFLANRQSEISNAINLLCHPSSRFTVMSLYIDEGKEDPHQKAEQFTEAVRQWYSYKDSTEQNKE